MRVTRVVRKILSYYESDNPGVKSNLCKILMHGKLAGTGKMVILPVDQGFEHGPARTFAINPEAYDPKYHFKLAINAGLNALAAPLGFLEMGANSYAGEVPLILKLNSANSLYPNTIDADQAITASVQDALKLGCTAVGFTIYPGSENSYNMMEQIRELAEEAKAYGLAVVIWSYPRGKGISKDGQTALDVTAYAAHMAALLGAHIIKVKPPLANIEQPEAEKIYNKVKIPTEKLEDRIKHIMQSSFNGQRLVVFSGGAAKTDDEIYAEIKALKAGGASGSIIGRNSFQRPYEDALKLLNNIIEIYKS